MSWRSEITEAIHRAVMRQLTEQHEILYSCIELSSDGSARTARRASPRRIARPAGRSSICAMPPTTTRPRRTSSPRPTNSSPSTKRTVS